MSGQFRVTSRDFTSHRRLVGRQHSWHGNGSPVSGRRKRCVSFNGESTPKRATIGSPRAFSVAAPPQTFSQPPQTFSKNSAIKNPPQVLPLQNNTPRMHVHSPVYEPYSNFFSHRTPIVFTVGDVFKISHLWARGFTTTAAFDNSSVSQPCCEMSPRFRQLPLATHTSPGATQASPGTTHASPGTTHASPGATHILPGTTHMLPGTTHIGSLYRVQHVTSFIVQGSEKELLDSPNYAVPSQPSAIATDQQWGEY